MPYRITPTRAAQPHANYPDFHAVGFDGNQFDTRAEAESALAQVATILDCEPSDLEVLFDTSQAYDVGFDDGQHWDYEWQTVQNDEWDTATINGLGAVAFGRMLNLTDRQIADRGDEWSEACAAYNRGCVDGVKYARSAD